MFKVLTIAGSDSSGGAGIQADLKTMAAHKVYGMSAITALTAQNTTGVQGILEITPEFVAQQIDSVFTDIRPDAVKIGMVSSKNIIEVIAERLTFYKAENIVVDPVMVSTSGSSLINDDAKDAIIKYLMPIATVITPNIPEAEVLSEIKINNFEDMEKAAEIIYNNIGSGTAVLVKGGHEVNTANDYLYSGDKSRWFEGERVNNPNTHGTGCTLSSAIASNLSMGKDLYTSVSDAKEYITGALKAQLNLGSGSGPLDHLFCLKRADL